MMNESSYSAEPSNVLTQDPVYSGSYPNDLVQEDEKLPSAFKQEDLQSILAEFQPIIRKIAGAIAARNPFSLDVEDLTSAGTMGLLSAFQRYDPTRETKFRTFAEYRIRGMMLDEIRAMDWVPRSVRSRQDQIRQVVNDCLQKTGEAPSTAQLAEALGIEVEELEGVSGCDPRLVSLDEPIGQGEEEYTLGDVIPDSEDQSPFWQCANTEMKEALAAALITLSMRQQEVLHLYYHAGLTMKEIGTRLGLTESGVCRVHSGALRLLRMELNNIENGGRQEITPKNRRRMFGDKEKGNVV